VKTECNLAASFKEGYGFKRFDLPMMMTMMIWKTHYRLIQQGETQDLNITLVCRPRFEESNSETQVLG
jgi:hypothetical protein